MVARGLSAARPAKHAVKSRQSRPPPAPPCTTDRRSPSPHPRRFISHPSARVPAGPLRLPAPGPRAARGPYPPSLYRPPPFYLRDFFFSRPVCPNCPNLVVFAPAPPLSRDTLSGSPNFPPWPFPRRPKPRDRRRPNGLDTCRGIKKRRPFGPHPSRQNENALAGVVRWCSANGPTGPAGFATAS